MRLKTSSAENRKHPSRLRNSVCGGARRNLAQVVEDARLRIEFLVLVLRKVVGIDVVSQPVLALGQRFGLRQQLDQRGFPGAVHSHQRNAVAALDHEVDVAKHFLLAVGLSRRR